MAKPHARLGEAAQRLEGAEHADDPVETAPAEHRVGVRPRDERRSAVPALEHADEVAGPVDVDIQAGGTHPALHLLAARRLHLRQGTACPSWGIGFADLRQRLDLVVQPRLLGEREIGSHRPPSGRTKRPRPGRTSSSPSQTTSPRETTVVT